MRKLIIITLPLLALFLSRSVIAQDQQRRYENAPRYEERGTVELVSNERLYDPQNLEKLKNEYMEMMRRCSDGEDSEFCRTTAATTLESLKEIVIQRFENTVEQMSSMIDRIKDKNDLSEEELAMLEETLEEYKVLMDEYKVKVENAETIQELQRIASEATNNNELQAKIRSMHVRRLHVGLLNIDLFVDRLNAFIQRLEQHVVAAQGVGHDTSEVENHIALAKEKISQAQLVYANNLPAVQADRNVNMDAAKRELLSAKDMLKEAKNDLRNAVTALRSLYKQTPWEVA